MRMAFWGFSKEASRLAPQDAAGHLFSDCWQPAVSGLNENLNKKIRNIISLFSTKYANIKRLYNGPERCVVTKIAVGSLPLRSFLDRG